ncbi:YtnP family quorum-quenching lactonase [Bacillus taeanensis]|uniref:MBL fold metallo-hydrolase n=1 Tax=Bacillus taeanensis TaxID=273032 RepID=A0A366Y213_9BACI|nr:MBL fold metallo-hydrolase [Bacillus taeanensis]RBW71425.1 MBL fold metallo-hydrolase [Bacillus taeanensis]
MEHLKIGNVSFYWLNGGVTHLDGGAMFGVVPKPLWSQKYASNANNQIELRTDPIFFQYNGKNILIESGIGTNKLTDKQKRNYGVTEESHLKEDLNKFGLTTADIDIVLMTHLHFDHANGLTSWNDNQLISTFPEAVIYTSTIEWEEMRNPNIRSINTYWEQNWKAVQHQVQTFEEKAEILPGLMMHHTGGHSAGHSIITFEQNGERFVHMADLMATSAHQHVLWVMAYDDYPVKSIEEKQKWAAFAQEKEAWLTFYHDAAYRALKWNNKGEITDSVKRIK